MVMVADLLPGLKSFLRPLGLRDSVQQMVMRMVIGFLLHHGRMSCLQAAGADRLETEGGIRKLKRLIRNSFANEYQAAV